MKISGEYGEVKIKEICLLAGFHVAVPCFALNVVTLHEQMFCTFVYAEPLVSAKTAEFFANLVTAIISKACKTHLFDLNCLDEVEKKQINQLPATTT